MNKSLKVTPYGALVSASIVAILISLISIGVSSDSPWLGTRFAGVEGGLVVTQVNPQGPAVGRLKTGDRVTAISNISGESIQLKDLDMVEDPDTFSTLRERDIFLERQGQIFQILQQPEVELRLADGNAVMIVPGKSRPLHSFPFLFWLPPLYGLIALLVGAFVWSIQQRSFPALCLLLSGFGAMVLLNSANISISRELALRADLFKTVLVSYHIGFDLLSLGMNALMWNYPKRAAKWSVVPLVAVVMAAFLVNEIFGLTELPGNTVLLQVPFYIATSLLGLVLQWLGHRKNPMDRAIIKYLSLVWLAISGTMMVVYFAPDSISWLPEISLRNSFHALLLVYLSFVPAVSRYRLFDIDRWWLKVWLWFFAGLAIVAMDLILVSLANLAPAYALGISVIVAAWLYFPLRQWFWMKMFPHGKRNLEDYVPMLIGHFVRGGEESELHGIWRRVLDDIFRPLSLEVSPEDVETARIVDGGAGLLVPCLFTDYSLALSYPDRGARLFNSDDSGLAQMLFNISHNAMTRQASYLKGMRDERKRIMRDLHDDVGGKLLTLVHLENATSRIASEALKRLREIIYSLDAEQNTTLNQSVAKWRLEALERCEPADIGFEWRWEEPVDDIGLSSRQALNLTLILREALSNIFQHARAGKVVYTFRVENGRLSVQVVNDGVPREASSKKSGNGLRNMRVRAEELDGSFGYRAESGSFHIEFDVPVGGNRE